MKNRNDNDGGNVATTPAPITRRKGSYRVALALSPAYYPFIKGCGPFEATIFGLLGQLCPDYTGGMWDYFALSNGTWYMAPTEKCLFRVTDFDGRSHDMSGDGAGLAVTLYLVNHLSWKFRADGQVAMMEAAAHHYHALRMYTYAHPDASAIWRVLD